MIFFERLLFNPKGFWQRLIVFALSPLGSLFGEISYRLMLKKKPADCGIKTLSVGNLTLGGSGKTPLTAAIAALLPKPAIILRGYGRKSSGLIVVERKTPIEAAGDEALLYKRLVPNAIVIVSADRRAGVLKAAELGARQALLDDGFRHREIKKLDLLIRPHPEPSNRRVLPAGAYRLPEKAYALADIIAVESIDFTRASAVVNPTDRMVLVTAISRAGRLDPFLPNGVIAKYAFGDHHLFSRLECERIIERHNADSLLVTEKDAVKLEGFGFRLSLLTLSIELSETLKSKVLSYLLNP